MVREEKKLISKPRVDLSRLPRTSLLWSHTSSMWTNGLLRASTRSNRGEWRLTWESWNHCDHVVLSCQLRWLISWMLVIGKEMTRLIMKNTMTIIIMRWKWWVMSKWLDWTLQNNLTSPNCSVASTACSSIHSTYHVLSGPSSETHKSLVWSCVIIEAKAGSSTGSQAAEELGKEKPDRGGEI